MMARQRDEWRYFAKKAADLLLKRGGGRSWPERDFLAPQPGATAWFLKIDAASGQRTGSKARVAIARLQQRRREC